MASSAADEPSPPPPPGGWISGLVSGAGRILAGVAAVLGPESSSDATSSSPESSQSPPRPARSAADQGNGTHFTYDDYQFNKSGKEIVLKDNRMDVLAQLLMNETFSRSEYFALTKIIQERVVDSDPSIDEPDLVLPIAWEPSTKPRPVALRLKNSPSQMSVVPAYSPLFDNTCEKRGLEKNSTTFEDPCTLKNLRHDQDRHVVKRSYFNTAETFEESRRIRPKLNRLNTEKVFDVPSSHAGFNKPVTNEDGELRGFLEELKDVSLLGTDNMTFSNLTSKVETAKPHRHLATASGRADVNKDGSAMFYPYSNRVEPFDKFCSLKPEMMHPAQKNDERTMSNDLCSVSKMVLQENVEAPPSSSNSMQQENSSRNRKVFNQPGCIPTKARSAANSSRRPRNRRTVRSWNGPPQQSNPASAGEKPKPCHIQEKRPVGRPRKAPR